MDDNFLNDLANDPKKYEKHLDDLMERVKKVLEESAAESTKKFLEKHGL
jgi:hypothetical protein